MEPHTENLSFCSDNPLFAFRLISSFLLLIPWQNQVHMVLTCTLMHVTVLRAYYNPITIYNLLQPHYSYLAVYTYLQDLETDLYVLELVRCVEDDSAYRGWQRGNFTHRF